MTDSRQVVQKIIQTAALSEDACAASLGISQPIFAEMLAGQRDIPDSLIPLLSAVLGVNESILTSFPKEGRRPDVVPAIWYKLRSDKLTDADREYVLSVRQLAFYQHEIELVTDSRSLGWKEIFETLRRQIDPQSSPIEQGRSAARLFRRMTGLEKGACGIGEVFRGHLRNIGILVIESSAPDSVLEGCSFYVGPSGEERPSIFANSYRTTWFRRNQVLMHELAHAIFDVESSIAALDYSGEIGAENVQEQRANSFAQEALIPSEVLRNLGQRNKVNWESFGAKDLATLVATTHVEQRLIIKALLESSIIDSPMAEAAQGFNIAADLRAISSHALTTNEFVKIANVEGGFRRRTTTTAPRKLMLPVRYVVQVLDAIKQKLISQSKAARMLMIEESEFAERFAAEQLAYSD